MNSYLLIIDKESGNAVQMLQNNFDYCDSMLGKISLKHRCGACIGCIAADALIEGYEIKQIQGFLYEHHRIEKEH